jgi:hypothetical protein
MVGSAMGMNYLSSRRDQFPLTRQVSLGALDLNRIAAPQDWPTALADLCQTRTCPDGVYALRGLLFRAKAGRFTLLEARETRAEIRDQ